MTAEPYYADDLVTLYHGKAEVVIPNLQVRGRGCSCGHARAAHAAGSDSKCLAVVAALEVPARVCPCREYKRNRPVAHVVITSPPYNMGLVPGGNGRGMYRPGASNRAGRFRDGYDGANDDAMPQDEYDAWQRRMLGLLWRAIPDDGAIFYNHRPRVEHGLLRDPLSNDFGGLPLRQRIIWNRLTGIDVNLRTFCTRGEYILFFAKPDMKLASHAASGMGDVWDLGMEHGVKDHPAPFPVSLPARCIDATAARSVFDPYSGSGSTLVAASLAGIPSIGVEKVERFCEITAKRLSQGVLDYGSHASRLAGFGSSGFLKVDRKQRPLDFGAAS